MSKIRLLLLVLVLQIGATSGLNQTELCTYCAQFVYGIALGESTAGTIQLVEMASEGVVCPWIIANWFASLTVASCTPFFTVPFNAVYPIVYSIAYPYRDFFCVPICGDSGQEYA